jgi:8-oxo-dGTP pyrophosphatase MutT (NUDIX family)
MRWASAWATSDNFSSSFYVVDLRSAGVRLLTAPVRTVARNNDRSKPSVEKIKSIREVSAGGVIWRRAGTRIEVVMVRPAGKRTWVLPKGGIELGESFAQAAGRECREETGLDVTIGDPLGAVAYIYSRRKKRSGRLLRVFKRVHFFLAQPVGGDPANHDDEIDAVEWFSSNDALEHASHQSERDMISRALELLLPHE